MIVMRTKSLRVGILALASVVLFGGAAFAQSSGISGVVRDTTGAVLPGVTVEATSPALIEKARAVVTDNAGLYRVVDLPPGVYNVVFTLPGFSTFRREGIELTTGFTASVNAELRVGSLEETVTVSGESPVVDVQNVVQQRVMTREIMDTLPTGRMFQHLAMLVPGMAMGTGGSTGGGTVDVGGSNGERNMAFRIHGSRNDGEVLVDGMVFNNFFGGNSRGNSSVTMWFNNATIEEVVLQTTSLPAEVALGGVASNLVPKDGSNTFRGSLTTNYSNGNLQADNLSDKLKARGMLASSAIHKMWDINPSLGGPLKRDKLWFFLSGRHWGNQNKVANVYFNKIDYTKTPESFAYEPDLSRPGIDDLWTATETLRLTWQATPRNKIGFYGQNLQRCVCHDNMINAAQGRIRSPEATIRDTFMPTYFGQLTWSAPITSRLLVEAGITDVFSEHPSNATGEPTAALDQIGVVEQSTNFTYRHYSTDILVSPKVWGFQINYRGAVSYVTGSHAVKVGFNNIQAWPGRVEDGPNLSYRVLNGVPNQVSMVATPFRWEYGLKAEGGIYAQDQWTVKRLTLNVGVRYDWVNAYVGDQFSEAGRFVPERRFAGVSNVPDWRDLSPRFGAAYDVFGNGKTAVKVSINKYLDGTTSGMSMAQRHNPQATMVTTASRPWTDSNRNWVPDCDLLAPAANGECTGPLSDVNFGKLVSVSRVDPDLVTGFGKRIYNWEFATSVQHELMPNVSVTAGYFRRSFGNQGVSNLNISPYGQASTTRNLAVNPATDFDPYCVTAPADPRLPGGGGYQVCGLYDVKPAKFGQTDNLVTFAKNFGTIDDVFTGFDFTMNMRLPRGVLLQGGTSTGREVYDACFVVNSPQELLYCRYEPPFTTQFKMLGSVPMPWGLSTAATFQSLPGSEILANYPATNAQIVPTLGRNRSSGTGGTTSIPLIEPGTMFEGRMNQLDVRLSKHFQIRRLRIRGDFDIYNALNASPVLAQNNTYGTAWLRPIATLPGRLFKFSAQLDF